MKPTIGIIALTAAAAFALAACDRTPSERAARGSVESAPSTDGQRADDASITADVKTALLTEPNISGSAINVDTNGGQVTLRGRVENQSQIERAAEIASAITGVRRVDNQLTARAG
jgi:hyperosmotically inducible periplasmic protein